MSELSQETKQYAASLRLTLLKNSVESVVHQAQIDKPTYLEYTHSLLKREIIQRQKTDYERRLKMAQIPPNHNLDDYDFNFSNGISKPGLVQLRELMWLEQNYNIILMGPSGRAVKF